MTETSAAPAPAPAAATGTIWLALASLYFIWGSTYLAIRVALDGFPPLLLAGLRFTIAGAVLLLWQQLRGAPFPTAREWGGAAIVGLCLVGGNTLVTVAELWVSSGLSAVAIGSVPLWVGLMSGFTGRWPARGEWLGIAVGFSGIALLNFGADMRGQPIGAAFLLVATAVWSLGSMLKPRLPMPERLSGSGALMLAGGLVDLVLAAFRGEQLAQVPSGRALFAFAWLVVLGSIVAYSAFSFLLTHVRPTLATSYAYVNPIVALILGALLLGEPISIAAMVAMVLILFGVARLARAKSRA